MENERTPEEHEPGSLMERSGLGLLPGVGLALVIALSVLAAVLIDQWWVVPVVAVAIMAITLVVVLVVLAVMEEEDEPRLRRHVPGL